jgi:hypothetical protein
VLRSKTLFKHAINLLTAGIGCALLASCVKTNPSSGNNTAAATESVSAYMCNLVSQNLQDLSGDKRISPGDKLTVVIEVSRSQDCSAMDGTLFGNKELVSVDEEKGGMTRFLTLSQATLHLGDGRLQSRGMDSLSIPTEVLDKLQQGGGQAIHTFELKDLFKEDSSFAVQGFDGRFAGMVGTAKLLPGTPVEFQAELAPLASTR